MRIFLVRIAARAPSVRYVVTDLRTGERHGFDKPAQLLAFLALQGEPRRLR